MSEKTVVVEGVKQEATDTASVESTQPVADTPVEQDVALETATEDEPQDVKSLPDWAQDYIKKLNKESAGRRVENKALSNQVQQFEDMFKQLMETVQAQGSTNPAVEQPEIQEVTPDILGQAVTTMQETLSKLSRENIVMRVSNELGLPVEIVQNLSGQTYDDLAVQAQQIASLAVPASDKSAKKVSNSPPKAPTAEASVGVTDAQRANKYFSAGGADSSGLFSGRGGVVRYDND